MLRNVLLLAVLAVVLGIAFGGCNSTSSTRLALMGEIDTETMLSLTEAIAVAQEEVPGGFAIEAELELEDDDEEEPPAYEVVFYNGANEELVEVEVHAMTGEVLEIEVGDDDDGDNDGDDDD